MKSQAARLRQLLGEPGALKMPGVWDPLSARIIEQAGWPAAKLSGKSVANSMLGRTDFGHMTQTEFMDAARRMTAVVDIPVVGDCDDGFGTPMNVYRTIQLCEQAGLAGTHLEDMAMPKRCVLLGPAALTPAQSFADKIKAATDARHDDNFVIVARTDKHDGISLNESIERANIYAAAGADVALIVGLRSRDEMEQACAEVSIPLIQVQVPNSSIIPMLPPAELEAIGFKILLYPAVMFGLAYKVAAEASSQLLSALTTAPHQIPAMTAELSDFMDLEGLTGEDLDVKIQQAYMAEV